MGEVLDMGVPEAPIAGKVGVPDCEPVLVEVRVTEGVGVGVLEEEQVPEVEAVRVGVPLPLTMREGVVEDVTLPPAAVRDRVAEGVREGVVEEVALPPAAVRDRVAEGVREGVAVPVELVPAVRVREGVIVGVVVMATPERVN